MRQLIMAAEGITDAWTTVLGMIMGAGMAHTLNMAASGAGVPFDGKVVVGFSIIITYAVGMRFREKIPATVTK